MKKIYSLLILMHLVSGRVECGERENVPLYKNYEINAAINNMLGCWLIYFVACDHSQKLNNSIYQGVFCFHLLHYIWTKKRCIKKHDQIIKNLQKTIAGRDKTIQDMEQKNAILQQTIADRDQRIRSQCDNQEQNPISGIYHESDFEEDNTVADFQNQLKSQKKKYDSLELKNKKLL